MCPCPMAIMLGSGFISRGLCGLPKLGGDDAVSIMFGSIAQLTSTFTFLASLHSGVRRICTYIVSKYSRNRICTKLQFVPDEKMTLCADLVIETKVCT